MSLAMLAPSRQMGSVRLSSFSPPLLVTRLTAVRGFAGHMLQDDVIRRK